MLEIKNIENYNELYEFHLKIKSPYIYKVKYDSYLTSLLNDVDSQGNKLFKKLYLFGAFIDNKLKGFIQFGVTNIGFDKEGNLTEKVNYNVIRNLYFYDKEVGLELLKIAKKHLKNDIYAFFHYFGMSCFARHGKLAEQHIEINKLLQENNYIVNEENIYYSKEITNDEYVDVELEYKEMNSFGTQQISFIKNNQLLGECEIHFVDNKYAYLRWMYIRENMQHLGYGSKCMRKLCNYLYSLGISKIDTDTAIDNIVAQKYYEKNKFINLGRTKSYIKIR